MNWACALPYALDFAPVRPSTTARCTHSAHEKWRRSPDSVGPLAGSGPTQTIVCQPGLRPPRVRAQAGDRGRAADRSWRSAAEAHSKADPKTLAHLVDPHVATCATSARHRRSKQFTLDALKAKLGKAKHKELTRERLIQFGKELAKEGAGPVPLSADFGYLKLVLIHATAVHGVDVKVGPVDLARVALKRLGLVGKSRQRTGGPRPTGSSACSTTSTATAIPRSRWAASCVSRLPSRCARRRSAGSAGATSTWLGDLHQQRYGRVARFTCGRKRNCQACAAQAGVPST